MLGDFINFTKGFAFKSSSFVSNGIKIVKVGNLNSNMSESSEWYYIDESEFETYKKYQIKDDDVIVSTVGSWENNPNSKVGKACIFFDVKERLLLNQNAVIIRTNNNEILRQKYLKYLIYNKSFGDYIIGCAQGSANQASITLNDIRNFRVEIPDIKIQDKIISILDSIILKMNLNNEINNNLLQLCRYKYDELNENYDSWNLVKINDLNLEVTDYVANGSFKSLADNVTLYDEKEYALYVRNTDLKVNFTDKRKYVDQKSYEFLKKSKLHGGELIISNVGDVGSVFICPNLDMPMTLGSNVIMLYSKDSHYYNYFLYFFFTSVYGQYMIKGITGGSAQPKFNKTDFRNMEIKLPSLEQLDKFNSEIDSIYKKYELNIKENEKLSELRDTLLPKLMNGEIDLDNIEI